MLNIDGYKNINKTIQKRPSQRKMIFKTSYKTLYKRLCWTFYYGLYRWFIIECYSDSKTFCKMFFKHNIYLKHFKNVFKMLIAFVVEKSKIKLFKKRPLLAGYVLVLHSKRK